MHNGCVSLNIISLRNNNCITNNGAAIIINPEIKAYMTDNGDGTYSYSFTSTNSGKLTIFAYLENQIFFGLLKLKTLDLQVKLIIK